MSSATATRYRTARKKKRPQCLFQQCARNSIGGVYGLHFCGGHITNAERVLHIKLPRHNTPEPLLPPPPNPATTPTIVALRGALAQQPITIQEL